MIWEQLLSAYKNNRLPQGLLLVGPQQSGLHDLVTNLSHLLLCQHQKSCKQCIDCQMVSREEHPDIYWIRPEKMHGPIKIDQIREINNLAYLTAQRGSYKIIIIESADRMNIAASNALLKTLEEPSTQTMFILIAKQLSTVLPTIISRCQLLRVPVSSFADPADKPLDVGMIEDLSPELNILTQEMIDLIEGKLQPFSVLTRWQQSDIHHILGFLYLVYAQVQLLYFNQSKPEQQSLLKLKAALNPIIIFNQLNKINAILKKLSHNMNINTTMALEDLLLTLLNDL